jgi:hypothetical protein
MSVAIGTGSTKFSAAVDKTGRIYVEGTVRSGTPYLTKIGAFDVELSVTGSVILCRWAGGGTRRGAAPLRRRGRGRGAARLWARRLEGGTPRAACCPSAC